MPRPTSAADRAALARRSARAPAARRDPCPLCGSELGGLRSTTRRRVVFSSTPGTFRWQCPDCQGVWEQSSLQKAPDGPAAAPPSAVVPVVEARSGLLPTRDISDTP